MEGIESLDRLLVINQKMILDYQLDGKDPPLDIVVMEKFILEERDFLLRKISEGKL